MQFELFEMSPTKRGETYKRLERALGEALIASQNLENALILFIILGNQLAGKVTRRNEVIDVFKRLAKRPLGQLSKSLKESGLLGPKTEMRIQSAILKRNFVVHSFLRSQAVELKSKRGQMKSIRLARTIANELNAVAGTMLAGLEYHHKTHGAEARKLVAQASRLRGSTTLTESKI